MAELNKLVCSDQSGNNTGIPSCGLDIKQIAGIILTPPGAKILAADMADLQTAISAKTLAAPSSRWYPIMNILAMSSDNSEAPVKQTFGYGTSKIIRDGNYDWTFQYDATLCTHKQIRNFNTQKWGFFAIDDNGVVLGYKDGDDLAAIPLLQFFAAPWKAADGSNETQYTINLVFKPKYANELAGFISTQDEFDIFTAVAGLLNVVIKEVTALAAGGVVVVKALMSCGGANLYGTYKTALSIVGAWVIKNALTGAVIALTTVAANDAGEQFTLTIDATDPAYPVTPDKLTISLATPTALAALATPMVGYESNALTETVPA